MPILQENLKYDKYTPNLRPHLNILRLLFFGSLASQMTFCFFTLTIE